MAVLDEEVPDNMNVPPGAEANALTACQAGLPDGSRTGPAAASPGRPAQG